MQTEGGFAAPLMPVAPLWGGGGLYKSALSLQQHRKVLDKGKPDDIMPAIKGTKVSETPSWGGGGGVYHQTR